MPGNLHLNLAPNPGEVKVSHGECGQFRFSAARMKIKPWQRALSLPAMERVDRH